MYKSKHPLYNTYRNMKARCNNEKAPNYKWYGAKGVQVCDRWLDSFDAFVEDMGPKPHKRWCLVRKDATKDYTPENCRWGPKGSEGRRPAGPAEPAIPSGPAGPEETPNQEEFALRYGGRVSKPLGTLPEAVSRRDRLRAELEKKGREGPLEIVRREAGGEWRPVMVKEGRVPDPEIQVLDTGGAGKHRSDTPRGTGDSGGEAPEDSI